MSAGGANRELASNEDFLTKIVYRFLLPSVFSMLGTRVSGLINGVLIGNMLGSTGLGVMSIVSPISLTYMSLGSLLGVGGSILSSIALGRGEKDACNQTYSLAYILALFFGLALAVVGWMNLEPIVRFLGARDENIYHVLDYARYYILGGMFTLLLYIPLNYLRIIGKPNRAMTMLLLMSLLNIVFSIFFVAVIGMGTGGVALGSSISACVTFVYGAMLLRGKDSPLKITRPKSSIRGIMALAGAGSPSALNNVCRAIQTISINRLLANMAHFLACYSLVGTGSDFVLAIVLGVSQTAVPLVGISFGERDYRSITVVLRQALKIGSAVIGVVAVLLLLFRDQVGLIFGLRDASMLGDVGTAFLFLALSVNLALINNLIANYFSATRRSAIANAIVVCRLVFYFLLPAYLLFPSIGIYAVWGSLILAEALTLLTAFIIVRIMHRRDPSLSPFLLLKKISEDSAVIDFSVKNTAEDAAFASEKISGFCEENDIPMQKSMAISLTLEELLVLVNAHSHGEKEAFTDIRIVKMQDVVMLRIRNIGRHFNPIEYYRAHKDDEDGFGGTLGIAMILKMAETVEYRQTFGVNNLIILI